MSGYPDTVRTLMDVRRRLGVRAHLDDFGCVWRASRARSSSGIKLLGCQFGQGSHLSTPLTADEVRDLLRRADASIPAQA